MLNKLYVLVILFIGLTSVMAEELRKHPRVAELEDRLIRDTTTMLTSRFPNVPFIVTASVDPLFRYERMSRTGIRSESGEKLPYIELDHEEIRDEWDDPGLSIYDLLLRVKKISVSISVQESITDDEAAQIREAIFNSLHLIPARDEVTIKRQKWKSMEGHGKYVWIYLGVGILGLTMMISALIWISKTATAQIASVLEKNRPTSDAPVHMPPELQALAGPNQSTKSDQSSNNLKMTDPIRVREVVGRVVDILQKFRSFPNLQDMLILNRSGQKNSRELGAVVTEFSPDLQKRIFSLCNYQTWWLDAYNDPGSIGMESLEILQYLLRNPRTDDKHDWQELLVAVWRLNDDLPKFLKSIGKDAAYSILSEFPKDFAIPIAKEVFPGAWGVLLSTDFKAIELAPKEISSLIKMATDLKPLNDFSMLEQYKSLKELIRYLDTASFKEERDTYEALPKNSIIRQIRPPFFHIFDLSEDEIKTIVAMYSPQSWAVALKDVPPTEVKRVCNHFSDKQNMLFQERIKLLENMAPDSETSASIKKDIAQKVYKILRERNEKTAKQKISSEQNKNAA